MIKNKNINIALREKLDKKTVVSRTFAGGRNMKKIQVNEGEGSVSQKQLTGPVTEHLCKALGQQGKKKKEKKNNNPLPSTTVEPID